jgi:hypothetical protein
VASAKRQISYRFLRRGNDRWYVQATTLRTPAPVVTRKELGALGADLNVDHLAVAEVDRFGIPAGDTEKTGVHNWICWKSLTSWLRQRMRQHPGSRSVQSGGASHPGGAGPPPATVRSAVC